MITPEMLNRTKDGHKWWVSDAKYAFEVLLPDANGKCDERALSRANEIEANIQNILSATKVVFPGLLFNVKEFKVGGIEIFNVPDRHGADSTLSFDHDGDGYMWIEIGLSKIEPVYILHKYH